MKILTGLATNVADRIVRNRAKLPDWVNSLVTSAAKNPDGLIGRLASSLLGGGRSARPPQATNIPSTQVRVYIGPTNYAAQGYLWARALEKSSPRIGARNMEVKLPGGYNFPADTAVPLAFYNHSSAWQGSELDAVSEFTHVLFEAERPLFGSMFGRDVAREAVELERRGVSVAFLSHGTDARSPRANIARTRWSPFADDSKLTAALQEDADRNLELLRRMDRPVFVSTPDLLSDVPYAQWCPVVVDSSLWHSDRVPSADSRPIVAHIPSSGEGKGTHLIDGPLRALERAGTIEYRLLAGIAAAQMPEKITTADIVLDQFRVGSYGVAACEAMAAGRVVLGHVLPDVRDTIHTLTGLHLPIVEAVPDNIGEVISALIADPGRMSQLAQAGPVFVDAVHSGEMSSRVLRTHWIEVSR